MGQGGDCRWTQYPEVKGTVATTLGRQPLGLIQTCGHLSSRLLSAWKDMAEREREVAVPSERNRRPHSAICVTFIDSGPGLGFG